MFYRVISGHFKKDYKRCTKRNYDMSLLKQTINLLTETGTLPESYLPHPLKGSLQYMMEAHIKPDWLIVWYISASPDEKFDGTVNFVRTGTHSDLFS